MRDVKAYVTDLEAPPLGRCYLLEGLRINSQSSDHLLLATKFSGVGNELNIVSIKLMVVFLSDDPV